jgi:hypothetical protein
LGTTSFAPHAPPPSYYISKFILVVLLADGLYADGLTVVPGILQ